MHLFDYWREQEMRSSMQKLQDDNARLIRQRETAKDVTYICVLAIIFAAIIGRYL